MASIKRKFGTLVCGVPRIQPDWSVDRCHPSQDRWLPGPEREHRYTQRVAKSARSTLCPLSGKFVTCAARRGRPCDVVPGWTGKFVPLVDIAVPAGNVVPA